MSAKRQRKSQSRLGQSPGIHAGRVDRRRVATGEAGLNRAMPGGEAGSMRAAPAITLANVVAAMERIAPTALAQDWDNVGLLAGDFRTPVRRVLLAIDLTPEVVEEAKTGGFNLILAYHPPIFRPIAALRLPSTEPAGLVFECIRSGVAVYSPHTALDAADGGTNDAIAELCGIRHTEPIEYVDRPAEAQSKIVVFVPAEHLEKVAEAMFLAGAGRIGDYTHCSFRTPGEGTFFGTDATNPTVGRRGRLELVAETRLECIARSQDLPNVIRALRRAHPYEEPAFDIYPLKPEPVRGIGRIGVLPRSTSLRALARKLGKATGAAGLNRAMPGGAASRAASARADFSGSSSFGEGGAKKSFASPGRSCDVQTIGDPARQVDRAVIVVGSAGSLPFKVDLTPRDVIVTGEIRHHDALTVLRRGCSAIALGHWESERPVLFKVAGRLSKELPTTTFSISRADRPPFGPA